MVRRTGDWSRMVIRPSWRTAATAVFCLVGIAAFTWPPLETIYSTVVPPHHPAIKLDLPTARPAASAGTLAVDIPPPQTAAAHRPPQTAAALPTDVAPLAAPRVLSGVTQFALALPEISGAFPKAAPPEDANSRLLREHFALLKAGRDQFSRVSAYTATMVKQERIGSELTEELSLEIKVRHQPFSVYLKWNSGDETGKEVLYAEGTNDDQLLVRLGGLKGRILPAMKIDPFGSLALRQSRYPITKLGILALADTLIERRELEMREKIVPRVEQRPNADCGGRPCSVYIFEVSDAQRSPVYRKSVQYIDRRWNVPLRVANYTWPEPGQHLAGPALDEATLIEYYMYSEIVADARLTDLDFDRANPEYRFHR